MSVSTWEQFVDARRNSSSSSTATRPCACGCGRTTKATWAVGHDARVWGKFMTASDGCDTLRQAVENTYAEMLRSANFSGEVSWTAIVKLIDKHGLPLADRTHPDNFHNPEAEAEAEAEAEVTNEMPALEAAPALEAVSDEPSTDGAE